MSASASARSAVVVVKGLTTPSLFDRITLNGRTVKMAGATVTFYMRPLISRTPVVNGVAAAAIDPPDDDDNNVRYDWANADVANEGEFMGWWRFELPSSAPEETPEFPIIVTDHGPGFGTQTGAVVDGASAFMPTTLAALRADAHYGDRFLQRMANAVKYRVLGTSVAPDAEAAYHPLLLDYLSKRLALDLTTPAIDYWQRQYRTQTTTGTSEVASYPDAIAALESLHDRLVEELAQDWIDLQFFDLDLPFRRGVVMPTSSLESPPRTKDPYLTIPLETGLYASDLVNPFPFP